MKIKPRYFENAKRLEKSKFNIVMKVHQLEISGTKMSVTLCNHTIHIKLYYFQLFLFFFLAQKLINNFLNQNNYIILQFICKLFLNGNEWQTEWMSEQNECDWQLKLKLYDKYYFSFIFARLFILEIAVLVFFLFCLFVCKMFITCWFILWTKLLWKFY